MSESYLAVDIGTGSIKAVEKDDNGNAARWGILDRRGRPFHANIQPLDVADASRHLKMLIDKMYLDRLGIKAPTEAVVSVQAFLLLSAVAPAPEARFIPAAMGTFRLASIGLESGNYLLMGLPNDVTEKYVRIFNLAGLNLIHMESESSALARTLGQESEPLLIVDVGDRHTTFTAAQNGRPIFIGKSDFGVASENPDRVPYITPQSYVRDVIMKEAEKIVAAKDLKKIVYNSPLSICNGLQRPVK
jgi:hypothetical protein